MKALAVSPSPLESGLGVRLKIIKDRIITKATL
jgi:hypothetical protein